MELNSMKDSNPIGLMDYLIEQFNQRGIAFVEVNEGFCHDGARQVKHDDETDGEKRQRFFADHKEKSFRDMYSPKFSGLWISNWQFTFEKAHDAVSKGYNGAISFGTLYVCNDNLVEKFKTGAQLNGP